MAFETLEQPVIRGIWMRARMQPLLPREREFQLFKGNRVFWGLRTSFDRGADFVALRIKLLCSSGSRLKHRHNRRTLKIACGDSFEVRADAAQFGSHKRIDKTRAPVEPGKQLVPDLVVNSKRDLRAVWPDLSEVNDSHQANVPTRGFKRVLIGHVALDRQKHGVSLKTERTAKAEINRLR
jgi:hypothetical protein